MTLDQVLTALVYLAAVFIIFALGKFTYDRLNRRFKVQEELVKKDNLALALALFGYYFGLVIALGGVLSGESNGLVLDLIDIFVYGFMSILLLNLSIYINDRIILRKFDNIKEIIEDQNAGTGIIEGANHIAIGLIIHGAMSGEGDVVTAAVFWALGQLVLVISGVIYAKILPFDLHAEIERDNVAVGVAFAGVLIGIGNIVRLAAAGDFISWQINLSGFVAYAAFGLISLPILRFLTDRVLLPGGRLTAELVGQEKPNIGAGALEAFSYIGVSFMLGWVV